VISADTYHAPDPIARARPGEDRHQFHADASGDIVKAGRRDVREQWRREWRQR